MERDFVINVTNIPQLHEVIKYCNTEVLQKLETNRCYSRTSAGNSIRIFPTTLSEFAKCRVSQTEYFVYTPDKATIICITRALEAFAAEAQIYLQNNYWVDITWIDITDIDLSRHKSNEIELHAKLKIRDHDPLTATFLIRSFGERVTLPDGRIIIYY